MNCILTFKLSPIFFLIVCFACSSVTEQHKTDHISKQKSLVKLENRHSALSIDTFGGAYVSFHLKGEDTINPFTWKLTHAEMPENNRKGAAFQGHFLCTGRWGSPTSGEIEMGVPHNGQLGNSGWTVTRMSDHLELEMVNKAPLDGMKMTRKASMHPENALFVVKEIISSISSIFRLNNIVQHVTIGPPFLTRNTRINTNATKGFMQTLSWPNPHSNEYHWPLGKIDTLGSTIDLRTSHSVENYVSTHIIEEEYGWVTALSPEYNLVLGYLWKSTDYPWLNIWHQNKEGTLWAKGLEFGTTGIGRSYKDLIKRDVRFHGYSSYEYLDAGGIREKSFICFLIHVSSSVQHVERVLLDKQQISVQTNKSNYELILTSDMLDLFMN